MRDCETLLNPNCFSKEHEFSASGDKPILEHIKDIKLQKKIHKDGKMEELKKQIVKTVSNNIKRKKISVVENEYPKYVEFVTKLNDLVKNH